MTFEAQRARSRRSEPESSWDRDTARLVALLEANQHNAVTIAAMHEHGIETPAQVIYALQLAGYDIDRAPAGGNPGGALGYRLRSGISRLDGRADTSEARARDESRHRTETPAGAIK